MATSDSSRPGNPGCRLLMAMLLSGLMLSGVAGIINQVLWQRALKIYLAGSEAISAMIVVFVFMLGLGLGSQWAGRLAGRLRNPLGSLAAVELGLAAVNGLICVLLSLDLTESIYSFQRVVASVGIPLRVLYSLTAVLLLTGPCLLMGMTIPFATEGCQRQLNISENWFLGNLFFLNTAGAVLGALVSGFLILPILGQKAGLLLAVGLNSLAGLSVVAAAWRLAREKVDEPLEVGGQRAEIGGRRPDKSARRNAKGGKRADASPSQRSTLDSQLSGIRPELLVGFALGFLSLAYEMYLFRIASLVYGPFSYAFSLVLALFLLTWSIGAGVARFVPRWIPFWLTATAISLAVVPRVYQFARTSTALEVFDDQWAAFLSLRWASFGLCFIPCFLFGVLFTQVVGRFAKSWGADVGRYFAFNTFGGCAGILVGTLVGFEFAPEMTPWAACVAIVAIWLATLRTWKPPANHGPEATSSRRGNRLAWGALAVFLVVGCRELADWERRGRSMEQPTIEAAYYGRGGVILIDREHNLEWDGLWHSELRRGDNYVGSSNWQMAVVPFLCRTSGRAPDVCVIGLGTGVTAGTLSRMRGVERIDVYEINEELKRVLADYPHGTMNVARDPKITIRWQDGRSGLALNGKKYDLISQQPLWLKQAGSSILLSREYMELVKSRLKPDGVFCIYCNTAAHAGNEEQARTVRQTARTVFPHCETFADGYMLVVSQRPFRFDRGQIEARLAEEPLLRRECEAFGIENLAGLFDSKRLTWNSPYLVTDDHPIIEYPWIARMLVRRAERTAGPK